MAKNIIPWNHENLLCIKAMYSYVLNVTLNYAKASRCDNDDNIA